MFFFAVIQQWGGEILKCLGWLENPRADDKTQPASSDLVNFHPLEAMSWKKILIHSDCLVSGLLYLSFGVQILTIYIFYVIYTRVDCIDKSLVF